MKLRTGVTALFLSLALLIWTLWLTGYINTPALIALGFLNTTLGILALLVTYVLAGIRWLVGSSRSKTPLTAQERVDHFRATCVGNASCEVQKRNDRIDIRILGAPFYMEAAVLGEQIMMELWHGSTKLKYQGPARRFLKRRKMESVTADNVPYYVWYIRDWFLEGVEARYRFDNLRSEFEGLLRTTYTPALGEGETLLGGEI